MIGDKHNTVTFEIDGAIYSRKVLNGTSISAPAEPAKNGFLFDGWIDGDGNKHRFGNPIFGNMWLAAAWAREIAINGVNVKNSNVDIYFDIRSANGKGYAIYVSETGKEGSFAPANASFNSKGAVVKKLAEGATYYVYVVYENAEVVEKSAVIKIEK
ncbi:MAG: InlB B-repeat-containing protein [Oscillospiraceae bacterium]|nr:InlB B-repeat-containing protein [Oscillospiraceae bacterium]